MTSHIADPLATIDVDTAALDALRAEFFANGFVQIADALPADRVNELLDAVDSVHDRFAEHPHRNPTPGGFNMRPVIDKHPAFRQLLIAPKTFPVVVRLLDHFNIQLMQSHLFEAEPCGRTGVDRVTGWHNDGGEPALEVNGIRAFGSLKVGYFLRDRLDDDMGSLMVVPGSHRIQGSPAFIDGDDPVGAIQIKARAGDAVIFHQGLWHAAAVNRADDARILLYYGYGYRVFRPIDYQSFSADFLADASPVERQLLGETCNHQGYYVPTEDDTPLKAWFESHFGAPSNRGNLTRVRAGKSTQ